MCNHTNVERFLVELGTKDGFKHVEICESCLRFLGVDSNQMKKIREEAKNG